MPGIRAVRECEEGGCGCYTHVDENGDARCGLHDGEGDDA